MFVFDTLRNMWGWADPMEENGDTPTVPSGLLPGNVALLLGGKGLNRVRRVRITTLDDWWLSNSTSRAPLQHQVVRDVSQYTLAPVLHMSSTRPKPQPPIPLSPLPQLTINQMLNASFSRFPDMPHGLEIPYAGIATAPNGSSSLMISGGFCGGNDPARKPAGNVYSRGFFNKTFALPLGPAAAAWRPAPLLPAQPRQNGVSSTVNGSVFAWGGFSYSEPW